MNAKSLILTITAAALLAGPAAVLAQQGPGGCDGDGPHGPAAFGGFGGFGGPDGDLGHGLLRLLPRLADRLELTEAQQAQILAIIEANRPALESLHDQAVAAREAFADAYGPGDFDAAAFRTFFEAQAALHVEMRMIGAAASAEAWAVLTPEQQAELLDLIELLRDGRGGPRDGGGKRLGRR
ncbi:MAG: Spy/CpxP family protein refolding chaperone [Thermoanaerobaculales bacterium]|jgi:Spy/CpxP family protein refolding chaperone|nr:Spy/CpxP family protein refolding chaperone [Thermoanaerobaculales bacterium]